jgi:hypothetical protein
MGEVSVHIVDPLEDKSWDVDLSDDVPMSELVPALLPELGLSKEGSFTLQNKRLGKMLGPHETLQTSGTKPGDSLKIVPAAPVAVRRRVNP